MKMSMSRFDIDKPLWDLSTFMGRFRHFFWVTDPRTVITSKEKLVKAKEIVDTYRAGDDHPELSREELIYAKKLVESSFHPDTGTLQNVAGRMSFQVPGGVTIVVALLTFYKTTTAVVFWQWVNQSFNALVNYTNRNAASDITTQQMLTAYVSATTSAVAVSIGLKRFLARRAHPFMQRFVPLAAVASANMINIPLMRQNELANGVLLRDTEGKEACHSKIAATKGISQVTFSRIAIATPGMVTTPFVMEALEKLPAFQRNAKFLTIPVQAVIVGTWTVLMVPVGCAVFPQRCTMKVASIQRWEPNQFEQMKVRYAGHSLPTQLYFNKGL